MSEAERAEAAFWAAFLRNRNVDAGTAGDGAVPVAGGYALCVAGTLLEYAIGAGSTRPLRADDFEVVEGFYAGRGLPARFELDAEIIRRDGALLRERGYEDEAIELTELEGATGPRRIVNGISVRTTGDRRAWSELLVRAGADQGIDPETLRRTAQLNAAAGQILVIASIGGADVGVGAAGMSGDAAVLYSGAVLPAFRGRGAHRALVDARLAAAHQRGAARAFTKGVAGGATERTMQFFGFTRSGSRRRVHRSD